MTYGEAWYQSKINIEKAFGFEQTEVRFKHQKRMEREQASKYYNKKLFGYWIKKLDDRLKSDHKEQILSALMFNNTEAYKQKIGAYQWKKDESLRKT